MVEPKTAMAPIMNVQRRGAVKKVSNSPPLLSLAVYRFQFLTVLFRSFLEATGPFPMAMPISSKNASLSWARLATCHGLKSITVVLSGTERSASITIFLMEDLRFPTGHRER
jgi:hypothetical protein